MKLELVTTADKRNASRSKKVNNDVMSTNCDVNVFFSIYSKFAAIHKPDSGRLVYKTYVFVNSNFLSYRT